jgi:plastocyanin
MKALRIVSLLAALTWTAACGGEAADAGRTGNAAATATPAAEAPAPAAPAATGAVHEVRMVTTQGGASGVFEPANLTVKKGDVIRYINDGGAAHNANFQTPPENSGKANLPGSTPYLSGNGETADVTVTMDPGTYKYQCDPHVATGMVGQVTVQ